MQLRLSVSVPTGPARAAGRATAGGANPSSLLDVLVSAPAGTPLRAAVGQLANLAGLAEPVFHVGAARPAPDHPLGVPPLVDGAVLTADQAAATLPAPGNLELHVIGGPDAGGVHLLTPPAPGRTAMRLTIGRGAEADIRIEDPDLSRRHAELTVSADWVRLADCGSTNGTVLGGARIGAEPVLLAPQTPVRVGETTLLLRLGEEPLETEPDRLGKVLVRVRPRVAAPIPTPRFELPPPPGARGLPAARRRAQAGYEQAKAATEAKISAALALESALRRTRHPDPAALLTTALRPGEALWSRSRDQPELLELRLGTARLPSVVTVRQGTHSFRPRVPAAPVTVDLARVGVLGVVGVGEIEATGPGGVPDADTLSPSRARGIRVGTLGQGGALDPDMAPYPAGLGTSGATVAGGATGSGTSAAYSVRALGRSLVAQLAALCSPLDVDLVVLSPNSPEPWRWTTWLPHCAPQDGQNCRALVGFDATQARARIAELTVRLEARQGALRGSNEPWPGRRTVLVVDQGDLPGHAVYPPELLRLLAEGPQVGMHALVLAQRPEDLPASIGAVATVGGEVHTRLRLDQPEALAIDGILADLTSPQWALRFAHALAPLRDAREGGVQGIHGTNQRQLPEEARLLPLLELDLLTPTKISARWNTQRETPQSADGLTVVLGADSHGAVRAELTGHHILVGGVSGSGVSEALRSVLCSAALPTPPERLNVLLVSGGGGPSWGESAKLPHVVEHLETPPTEPQLRRLLTLAVTRSGVAGARVLLGVDGLDRLAAQHPWFVKELTELAQQGRKVGVHLLLGITLDDGPARRLLDGELCEELDLRLALRTYGPEESRRLVSLPDAAAIRPSLPGRAWLALPDGRVLPVQVPRVGGRMASSATARANVTAEDWRRLGDALPPRGAGLAGTGAVPVAPGAPTDLALLVESAQRAAAAKAQLPGQGQGQTTARTA
ncbi:FHA domain-containing protein [Actinospica durhamensis]|uniref:FHA domain-containing protein n=1 Tax=Actinospica durhamensis TaxID=1508375 RepID=A0A941EXL4_9ACTN|nr:FHA domain-containing protein [Actinospica durhamensis]MBR7835819.1 FHA domain-containing protein [Actinospica durhamensis]